MKAKHERILRLPEVQDRTGLRRERIRQLEVGGLFPRRFKINGDPKQQGAVGWVESEIDQWIDQRVALRAA